jgi:hypothetical protein
VHDGSGKAAMERRRFLIIGTAGIISTSAVPVTASAAATPPLPPRAAVEAARAAFRASDYRQMAARLLPLTARADAVLAGLADGRRDAAAGDFSLAFSLLSQWHVKGGDDEAAGQAADRALELARQSGSPIAVADAAQRVSVVHRRAGAFTAATDLVVGTARELGADSGDPDADVLAAYGSLLASASYAYAQAGNAAAAVGYAELAEEAAARMRRPGRPDTFAADFSVDQTRLYRIGVHHALGQDAEALTWADRIVPARLPNAERHPGSAWTPPGPATATADQTSPWNTCSLLSASPLKMCGARAPASS